MNLKIALVMLKDLLIMFGIIVWWYDGFLVMCFIGVEVGVAVIWPLLLFLAGGCMVIMIVTILGWIDSAKARAERSDP